jgi:hypothetical protein
MALPPDPVVAVLDYLKADPDIAALVADRAFIQSLPEEEARHMPRACVVIRRSGGRMPANHSQQIALRVDVRTYGRDSEEVSLLQGGVIRALQNLEPQDRENSRIYNLTMSSGPSYAEEPDTNWPFEFSVWMLQAHLTEV